MTYKDVNWKNLGGKLAAVLAGLLLLTLLLTAVLGNRIRATARKLADDIVEARTRQRTVEVRKLTVDDGRKMWFGRGATAFEVRDTATGASWLVLQPHPDGQGIVLPASPDRIAAIAPEPR